MVECLFHVLLNKFNAPPAFQSALRILGARIVEIFLSFSFQPDDENFTGIFLKRRAMLDFRTVMQETDVFLQHLLFG